MDFPEFKRSLEGCDIEVLRAWEEERKRQERQQEREREREREQRQQARELLLILNDNGATPDAKRAAQQLLGQQANSTAAAPAGPSFPELRDEEISGGRARRALPEEIPPVIFVINHRLFSVGEQCGVNVGGVRALLKDCAERLGLCGWVQRMPTHDVMLHCEGTTDMLSSLRVELEAGMQNGLWKRVETSGLRPLNAFDVRCLSFIVARSEHKTARRGPNTPEHTGVDHLSSNNRSSSQRS